MEEGKQTAVEEKELHQPEKAATEEKKETPKEPLDVVKWSGIDPITGQKVQREQPVYTIEEYRELASKGLAADSKWQAIPTLVKQQAGELAKQIAAAELEPRVQSEVERRLADIKERGAKINEDLLSDGDPKETAKAILDLKKQIADLGDVVLGDKLEQKTKAELYSNYNKTIEEALQQYPNVKKEDLVPFVANELYPQEINPKAIMAFAKILNGFAMAGIDVDNLTPEQREKVEAAFKGKEPKAPSPGPEGGVPTKKVVEAPKNFDEMLDQVSAFNEAWLKKNK